MYGYVEYNEITPEQLLQKVSQEQIFEFVLKQSFKYGANQYISPFREDTRPGCRFEPRPDGTIVFVDFGERATGKTHRSCFAMVMEMYNVSLSGAVDIICEHFGLSKNSSDYKPIIKTTEYIKQDNPSSTIITYDKIPYAKRDILHWSQFIIRPEHLLEDNVFATNKFYIQGASGKRRTIQVYGHCYAIDFIDTVKIYQPYSEKYKWITNCDEDDIGNFDNLPATADELVITKSYKDHRVLRNLEQGYNVIWFQNEGCVPSEHILRNILSRFKLITLFFDNDLAGRKAAKKLMDILNHMRLGSTRSLYLPRRKYQWKDPGQFVAKEGRKDLITTLKSIGL